MRIALSLTIVAGLSFSLGCNQPSAPPTASNGPPAAAAPPPAAPSTPPEGTPLTPAAPMPGVPTPTGTPYPAPYPPPMPAVPAAASRIPPPPGVVFQPADDQRKQDILNNGGSLANWLQNYERKTGAGCKSWPEFFGFLSQQGASLPNLQHFSNAPFHVYWPAAFKEYEAKQDVLDAFVLMCDFNADVQGGWVMFAEGNYRKVTAEEFNRLPKFGLTPPASLPEANVESVFPAAKNDLKSDDAARRDAAYDRLSACSRYKQAGDTEAAKLLCDYLRKPGHTEDKTFRIINLIRIYATADVVDELRRIVSRYPDSSIVLSSTIDKLAGNPPGSTLPTPPRVGIPGTAPGPRGFRPEVARNPRDPRTRDPRLGFTEDQQMSIALTDETTAGAALMKLQQQQGPLEFMIESQLQTMTDPDFNENSVLRQRALDILVKRGSKESLEYLQSLLEWDSLPKAARSQIQKAIADLQKRLKAEGDKADSTTSSSNERTWKSGKFTVNGVFRGIKDDVVTIERSDNKQRIEVPLDKLSAEDQAFVKAQ